MAKVRIGVIGAGAIAQHRHLPESDANRYSTVGAIADPVEDRVKALGEQYGATPYTDYKKMLKSDEVDAVVVSGPNALHAQMSIDAMRAGKHVLCEKPMATTRADAKRMVGTAKKTRKFLMIGLNQRLMPPHVRAKEILDGGRLGKVLAFRTAFKHPGPEGWSVDGSKSWFFQKGAAAMGVTGDLGVHKADLMRWLLGDEFVSVGGVLATLDKKGPDRKPISLDDNAYLTLQTKKGIVGSMILSWTNYGAEENYTVLYCQNGVLSIGTDPEYGVVADYANGDREMHRVGKMSTNEEQVASGIIDDFVDSIRKNKKPSIDGMEGYKSLDVILTAMDAAAQGKTLKIRH